MHLGTKKYGILELVMEEYDESSIELIYFLKHSSNISNSSQYNDIEKFLFANRNADEIIEDKIIQGKFAHNTKR